MLPLPFNNDLKLFTLMKEQLYSAVLCNALDQAGFRQQAMRANIRPVYPDAVVVSRAVTMQSVDIYQPEEYVYEHEAEKT